MTFRILELLLSATGDSLKEVKEYAIDLRAECAL